MPEKHAVLSASSANKWLNCQASARLEELMTQVFGENGTEYTKEGTIAHSYAERSFTEEIKEYPNEEMKDAVETYHNYVLDVYEEAKMIDPLAIKEHEIQLDYSKYVKDGFGTGDTVIISDGTMHVIDFKYGKGVSVSAYENPQMKLYGLGALDQFSFIYRIDNVKLHIVQPRIDNISTYEISVSDLLAWGESIKEIGVKAFVGDAECNAGEHCQFCRARAICRARASLVKKFAAEDKDFKLLSTDEIGEVYKQCTLAETYIKQLKAYVVDQMMSGVKIKGLKLKAPRQTRAYADQESVEAKLKEMGFDDAIIHKPRELINLTELETIIKKKGMDELENNGFIVKVESANPSVVSEDDPCEEWQPKEEIKKDFETLE